MGRTSNTLPRFDTNLQKGDAISALQWNALGSLLNGIKAFDGLWIKATQNGLHIGGGGTGSGVDYSKWAFGFALTKDAGETEEDPPVTVCTVSAGRIHKHGLGSITFPQVDVTLLAETCTVYAQCARNSYMDGSILVSASPSATSNTHYRFPLHTFTYNESTNSHALQTIHNLGDIHLDTPTM
jgi:hypothetical protein